MIWLSRENQVTAIISYKLTQLKLHLFSDSATFQCHKIPTDKYDDELRVQETCVLQFCMNFPTNFLKSMIFI